MPSVPRQSGQAAPCLGKLLARAAQTDLGAHGGRRGECHRRAGEIHAKLRFGRVEDIFSQGLEAFLNEMMARNIDLGGQIAEFYLHN